MIGFSFRIVCCLLFMSRCLAGPGNGRILLSLRMLPATTIIGRSSLKLCILGLLALIFEALAKT